MSESLAQASMHRQVKGRHLYEILTLIQDESKSDHLRKALSIWLHRTHLGLLPK